MPQPLQQSFSVPIAQLMQAPGVNPNKMSEEQFALLKRAIDKLGFLQPIVVIKDVVPGFWQIRDGHHRVRAAAELGMTDVAAVEYSGSDEATAKAITLGMNRLRGDVSLTDAAALLTEIAAAGWAPLDMTLTGFGEEEIAHLLELAAATEVPDVGHDMGSVQDAERPPPPTEWILEIPFDDQRLFKRAKKLLRRASGKGEPLFRGLMKALGEEE